MAFPSSPHPGAPLSPGPLIKGSGSQNVVPRAAASLCPGNWLEMQTLASSDHSVTENSENKALAFVN